jgi:hypothetical protein
VVGIGCCVVEEMVSMRFGFMSSISGVRVGPLVMQGSGGRSAVSAF